MNIQQLQYIIALDRYKNFTKASESCFITQATMSTMIRRLEEELEVVIFDRSRENFRRFRKMNTVEIIDNAITSTISRTIITHGSTQVMVLSMLLFGGQTLHYFAMALTIGILFGIYSSVFVAAAIAMWLGIKREDLVKPMRREGDANDPNAGATV